MYRSVTKIEDFAELLKERRNEVSLKQETLADYQGLSRFTLGNIEKGKADPKLGTILKVLDGLGLSLLAVPKGDLQRVLSLEQVSAEQERSFPTVAFDEFCLNGDDMDDMDLSFGKKAP